MDCGKMITSEDYIDIIVSSSFLDINNIEGACYINVNERISNVYIPVENVSDVNSGYFRYEVLPKCYTIMDERENVAESIFAEIANKQLLDGTDIIIGFIDTGERVILNRVLY